MAARAIAPPLRAGTLATMSESQRHARARNNNAGLVARWQVDLDGAYRNAEWHWLVAARRSGAGGARLITPLVQQRTVSLPPAFALTMQLVTGVLFGPLGLILGAPLAAVALVTAHRLVPWETPPPEVGFHRHHE